MHAVTPSKNNRNVITLPPLEPWKARRGHQPRRGGAGLHQDRRMRRLRTRGEQSRAAVGEE
jgi:hypothetical protein